LIDLRDSVVALDGGASRRLRLQVGRCTTTDATTGGDCGSARRTTPSDSERCRRMRSAMRECAPLVSGTTCIDVSLCVAAWRLHGGLNNVTSSLAAHGIQIVRKS
jgi:hypothetical protein